MARPSVCGGWPIAARDDIKQQDRHPMTEPVFCYHCRLHHPKAEMRQIVTRGGKRWRCIKSIEATKRGSASREAFGQRMTATNKAEAQAILRFRSNPERSVTGK
jgi:hypothetical protein